MKTCWTKPGTGATLRELCDQAHVALPHLCGPGKPEDELPTDLAITATGMWEPYDMQRIQVATCSPPIR